MNVRFVVGKWTGNGFSRVLSELHTSALSALSWRLSYSALNLNAGKRCILVTTLRRLSQAIKLHRIVRK